MGGGRILARTEDKRIAERKKSRNAGGKKKSKRGGITYFSRSTREARGQERIQREGIGDSFEELDMKISLGSGDGGKTLRKAGRGLRKRRKEIRVREVVKKGGEAGKREKKKKQRNRKKVILKWEEKRQKRQTKEMGLPTQGKLIPPNLRQSIQIDC